MTFPEKNMPRFVWMLVLAMASPVAAAAVDEAATAKDNGVDPDRRSADAMARDYLRVATSGVTPLSRLLLSKGLEFTTLPGNSPNVVSASQWRAIRDDAVRDGADDPMVQAVFLLNDRSSTEGSPMHDHAVDVLTRQVGENGHFGLVLLSLPEVAGDPQAERDILHQAARAKAFASPYTAGHHALAADLADMHWTPEATAPFGRAQASDETLSAVVSSSLAGAGAIAQLGPIFRLCKPAVGAVRADCQLLGQRLFKNSETAIDAMMSLRLIEMTAPDDEVRTQAANERRRFEWQSGQLGTLWADGKIDSPAIRHHLERQRRLTELEAMHQTLVALNLPLEPPIGWRSSSERFGTPVKPEAAKSPSQ